MNILVTGTDGVVGGEIVAELKKNKKYKLLQISNKRKIKKKSNIFYCDLKKKINLKLKPYAIIHCAAKHSFSQIGNDNKNIYSSNLDMAKNIAKFANKNNVKKIIFLSSTDVYGIINNKIVTENQRPYKPNSYGKSKYISEKIFCDKENKFNSVCLRIPSVFSFNLKKNNPLIITILKKIIKNENVYAYNLNEKFNNVLDSKEIVKLINIILKKKKIKNGIYNFSSSNPIKFLSVIKLIKKILNSKSEIIDISSKKKPFQISNKKIVDEYKLSLSSTKKIIIRCCQTIKKFNYTSLSH